ncbi:sister chromatid cohesion protein PDS5 homolog A isoform X1 [Brassica rapa]|uniref:sister chromatid cohesion protein PDS5 homolog A isoform X1 n=1 Tax=Brassica campestris TaxID=3711 RepID=UPI0004F1C801|nr:sister chromatid cohesion protein PDS5 homolog A isoform X1 [Brassica rapa]XP_018512228.1 sister chromatid cohesion protein PDS5 homolog A isoform X1 [Brassica rapa]
MAEEQLKEFGSKLDPPPSSKDSLLKLFKEAAVCLSELEQSPPASVLQSIQPFLDAVIKPDILKHQDKDVKLLVASCFSEITRITAPEAPYHDDIMRDIFQLIVSAFSGLDDVGGPSFGRRVVILETVAKYRSCIVMLDLECDELVKEVFTTFLDVARDDHPEVVVSSMQNIMIVLLEESEDVQEQLLLILLSKLGRNRNDVSDAARRLAMKVIEQCAPKVESDIKQFLISSLSGDSRFSTSQIDCHEVIYDLYRCAPQCLSGVAPYLTGELLADELETRLKVVGLVGELFSLPGRAISEEFSSVFVEFLKRLTDRVVEVRMLILDHIKKCLLSDPSRAEASQIISALSERLLDYDENIRKQVVAVICDVAVSALTSIPVDTIKLVAERLRDKAILVKTYTMERLTELYRVYCLRCTEGKVGTGDFEWIPGKFLRCLYDKDFRSDTIEYTLSSSLFPSDLSVRDKVKHWIDIFSGFDNVETKAFEKILEQRQRIQQEMQKYLSFKQMQQSADAPEMQKKFQFGFRVMSRAFSDPPKAEQNFLVLDQLKDANIWKILNNLLDPNTGIVQAAKIRDDMLKILSEKHSLYEFLGTLSIKCSYLLFSKEYVKEMLSEVSARKASKDNLGIQSCMDFLGLLASYCPSLFDGAEEKLISFLKYDDETIKEGTLKILAKAGGTIRENLIVLSSSVDLLLERICVEGNRKQAKYAVQALASITKDDGLKALSVLYKGLVDMLDDKRHQPAVLQSLGCIAQIAMPVFETRETEIVEFIRSKILKSESEAVDDEKLSWDDKSEICQLKIYGIKTLVKSYLPLKDAHLRTGVDDLLGLLKNILSFGEVSEEIDSSVVDKAHMKLAAAKAVLRLSRHWDDKIPIDIFHLTLKTPEISFPMAKKIFLGKVHQYIKDRVLETKYVCSFLFDITGSNVLVSEEEKQNLADIIQHSYQTKVRKVSAQTDANSVSPYPHSILPYLFHALAHHSCPDVEKCKDVKEYEMIYRQLYLIISLLLHKEEEGKAEDTDKEQECVPTIISIFNSIKQSEDVTDATKSKNSHAICELGLSVINQLTQKEPDLKGEFTPVSLPPTLYKPSEKTEGDNPRVGEEKLWLADETVLAHFSSLKLDGHADSSVIPQTSEHEGMNDEESDDNEIPLGKILERLRAQRTKSREGEKNKSVPAEDESGKTDVDVLKMVREINLDHLRTVDKFESSNGHTHSPGKRSNTGETDQKATKRSAGDGTSVVSVPKRRRSSSGHSPFKFSNSGSKKELHEERDMDSNDENSNREKRLSSRTKKKIFSENHSEDGNCSDRRKQSRSAESGDRLKSSSGSMQKRKRKGVTGLAKCSTEEKKMVTDELIGCKIDVWWPVDKRFYEGTVKSYDSTKQKHVILYEDGDVEVLRLDKERWELVDSGKPTKKTKTSKRSSNKKGSSGSKHKNSDALRRDEDPIPTTPKGKRTPKKYTRHKHPEGTPGSPSLEHEKLESRTKKNRSAAIPVGVVAEETNEKNVESTTELMTEDQEYGKEAAGEEKSESEGKLLKEGEDDDEEEIDLKEAKAESSGNPEGKETDVDNSDSEKKQENDDMETEAEAEDDAEDADADADADASDNETLGAWRSKVAKSSSKKAA